MEGTNMDNYSIPRRIWRIIYPILIFLGVQFGIAFIIGIGAGVFAAVQQVASGADAVDFLAVIEEVVMTVLDNAMLIVLVSNLVNLAIFTPIWIKTRRRLEPSSNKGPLASGLLIAGFFAGLNIVLILFISLADIMRFFPSYEEVAEKLTQGSFMMQVISVGIAAPIVEEMVFRGVLMGRMRWLPAWASVIIQAVSFGLMHLNPFQSLYALVVGVLLGLIYVKFRSIIMVIAGHIAFNLTSVLLSELMPEEFMWLAVLLGIAATGICAILTVIRPSAAVARTEQGPVEFEPL